MKTIKFQVTDGLWERFFRAFPGHGERSTLLRKIVQHIVINKPQHLFFHERIGDTILETLQEGDSDE